MFEWYYVFIYLLVLQFLAGGVVFSIWIHRINDHRMLDASKPFAWFCRVFTWLVGFHAPNHLRGLAAQHVKHHIFADRDGDPHSPWTQPAYDIMFKKPTIYHGGYDGLTKEEVDRYCPEGVPDYNDWFNQFACRYKYLGWCLLMSTFWLFGLYGFIIGLAYSLTIGKYGAKLHHLISHKYGYRHVIGKTDKSVNFYPFGTLLYWGEELHNNHSNDQRNLNFGKKWWEIDVMYYVIRLLLILKLVKKR